MKKLNFWTIWAAPLTATIVLLLVTGIISYFQRLRVETDLSALLPDEPLAYAHIPSLKTQLPQLLASKPYQHVLASPAFQQLQQTPEWQEFTASFPSKLPFNPMRLIGKDVVFSVHESATNEVIPPMLLLSRVDWFARRSEQFAYAVNAFLWKQPITVAQPGTQIVLYQLQTADMLFPLYYTVIDDVLFLSTSLPLLDKTVKNATAKNVAPAQKEQPEAPLFSAKLRPADFLRTLERSPFFQMNRDALSAIAPGAELDLSLNALPDEIRLDAVLSLVETPRRGVSTQKVTEKMPRRGVSTAIEQDTAILAGLNRDETAQMMDRLETMFPQMERYALLPEIAALQAMTDGRLECQSSSRVAGLVYAVPDVSCLTTFRVPPEMALTAMQRTVTNLLDQAIPPAQRNMVKQSAESYHNAALVKVALLIQELLAYGVVPANANGYGMVGASSKTLKREMDRLFTLNQASPYRMTAESGAVANIIFQPPQVAALLKNLAQTPTFSILLPKSEHPQFYASLPLILMTLSALPPVALDAQINDATLRYSLRLYNNE
ncbi:hypothetical protein U14_05864 [Candidatus Moduliflexus flocculans]|uniref:Uncharacterized protein n=1 Tax=Candidatus Moduliflexus flocculans TaxID=1499966 RepID=A0A081BT46_9BACT|nr:hypothetical protein U14_05864 [Candidatus Moduliflexus flocculans]